MKTSHLLAEVVGSFLAILATQIYLWVWLIMTKFLCVIIGIIVGWVTGCFFADIILGIFAEIGITGFSMWQIGAFLGFVGSFFGNITYFDPRKKKEENNQYYDPHRGMFH